MAKIKLTDWIDCFDCNENKQKNVTSSDLKTAERNYNPAVFHAPVTTDHKEDGPALGRIKAVKAEGNKFFVKFEEVSPQMADYLKSGGYKYRSMEFYKNLNGNGFYPRACSFVQFPECKSQQIIQLSEDLQEEKTAGVLRFSENESLSMVEFPTGEFLCYEENNTSTISYLIEKIGKMFQSVREYLIASDGIEKTDSVLSSWDIDSLKSAPEMLKPDDSNNMKFNENIEEVNLKTEELEALKKQIRDEEALKFNEKNKELLKFKETTIRKGYEEKFESLLNEGKVLPKEKESFIAFMENIDGSVIKFSETENVDALKFFEDILGRIPKNTVADLSGESKYKKENAKDGKEIFSFTETNEEKLHEKVLKFSEDHNLSYEDAFNKVIESEGK
jgi:hypothetical protein